MTDTKTKRRKDAKTSEGFVLGTNHIELLGYLRREPTASFEDAVEFCEQTLELRARSEYALKKRVGAMLTDLLIAGHIQSLCGMYPMNRNEPVPGICEECDCTEHCSCRKGCSWANKKRTLCSRCKV